MNLTCRILTFWIFLAFIPARIRSENYLAKVFNTIYSVKCSFRECCNADYIPDDLAKLDTLLQKYLYGQEIVSKLVMNALRGHINAVEPPKALSLSFHGPPGTGKTFVAQMIAAAIYKKGMDSQYYHFFNGRNDFPLQSEVDKYKEELHHIIINSLQSCERSMFVFDEVDKMPEGLLDVLVPFLDYSPWHKSWRHLSEYSVYTGKAIYIFLSNTGSTLITKQLLSLWEKGRQRSSTELQDFENIISVGAFNEKGGLYHSDTIFSSAIDHFVPFLPLEEEHVKMCLIRAFVKRGISPTKDMLKEALSYVTYGPPPHFIYSQAGCKRLEQKVASIIYAHGKKLKNEEL